MAKENKYEELYGCSSRDEYLTEIAAENGVDEESVRIMADLLGEGEDFDGLISMIDDFAYAGLM